MTNPPHNVELEAAKFLHKLIQDSKDEPKKLATKLYVILQHMRSSGKENSMPYQVISRAMETVIKQHELDIEALVSSRHPLAPSGAQLGEPGSSQAAGSSPRAGGSKDSNTNLAGNELSKPDVYPSGMPHGGPSSGGLDLYPSGMPHGGPSSGGTPTTTGGAGMVHGMTPSAALSYPLGETGVSVPKHFASSTYENHGVAGKMLKEGIESFPSAAPSMDPYTNKTVAGGPLDEGVNLMPHFNKSNQASDSVSAQELSMSRHVAPRDTGKAPLAQAPVSGLPFKEHHLKQLRAQCLVFLAFRNGLMPKKLHLEIALGNFIPKEDGPRRDMNDHKGKEQSVHEQHSMPEVSGPTAGLDNTRGADKPPTGISSTGIYHEASFSLGAEHPSMREDKISHQAMPYEIYDERRPNFGMRRKPEIEMSKQERSESQASSLKGMQYESALRSTSVSSRENELGNNQQQQIMAHHASFIPGTAKYMKPEMTQMSNWPASEYQLEASRVVAPGITLDSQLRKDAASQFQSPDNNSLGYRHTDSSPSLPLREQWKPIPGVDGQNVLLMPSKNSDALVRNVLPVQDYHMDDQDASASVDCAPSPKYTTFDYMIMAAQKRKLEAEKTLAIKYQKIEEKKIAVCSAKLKESATSSEDKNEKTKRVIELKKLKLLDLQRRIRSDIMNDYFKPITSDMDRLKSIKKHRIGRRSKQLERYEGKMKEERQKRMRERQKDFFGELEAHRERLEDVFKMRRERFKGFNRNVREFHKRKERSHREKIDRIQREKINLLKINDVEGYLRMVKDAKSDRVKQLLKETEKYLSKLGSKLQQAKNTARRFESDVDDGRNNMMVEKNEISFENEDETDQAKHYLESNEKYYLLAHSVKETVLEQPAMLVGGKLREYQMNGLRWLVSLYNNHLNGILADEMGLGKTVQVISLLCHLMETKNDRGPFLVVVPSSVLPGWETEINFWAPGLQKIVYSGPPEERRRLFKEQIISQKFNVLLTTYEYLMNKHDRPKLSKVQWHYIIIDEGHRIKNASCKLNADLKHYRSNHRLLLTGTPLQNNLEELWALLNFLLPNIFNSSEDFSQWFNKPFESNGDSSADEALLSEEENLLIINRLHQVLRPFVLRRLKHKVENELPEKIERLIRCEASGYQKLLMKRVEDNLGAFGATKVRSVHNSVMELRNICNHPYLSQLHIEEVHDWMPKHYLPNIVRLCGKLEMLDRLLPKLKETDHRVLLFSTMTRLLDVLEDYLCWKQYKYLRLDGHTSGGDRGALIDNFNQPGSPFFIFLLSIRAGGVGVNLQAADTVIIFDTDWNPQVDLQAQARAHRIGQKKDVLVLRLETVQTVEEQVRASAEHKLGVANQSITAGFFDNNTSAEDRREYLESLLRECKKEEAAPVLDDDGLNDIIARSESEIDVFESIDRKRRAEEREAWVKLIKGNGLGDPEGLPPLPSRLLMEDELKTFSEAMKKFDVPQQGVASNSGTKRKGDNLGSLDTRHYGRGKRAREVRSYEEQMTEEEFEKLCQVEGEAPVSPRVKQDPIPRMKDEITPQVKEELAEKKLSAVTSDTMISNCETQGSQFQQLPRSPIVEPAAVIRTEVTTPSKRGRGRPRRTPTTPPGVNQYSSRMPATTELSSSPGISLFSSGDEPKIALPVVENVPHSQVPISDILPSTTPGTSVSVNVQLTGIGIPSSGPIHPTTVPGQSMPVRGRGRGRKAQSAGEPPRRRGKRQSASVLLPPTPTAVSIQFEAEGEGSLSSPGFGNPNLAAQHSGALGTTDKSDSQAPRLSASKSDSGSEVQVLGQSIQPNVDACFGPLGPQQLPVPNQSIAPASDAPSGSRVTTGEGSASTGSSIMAGDAQDPAVAVMVSPSPNPVPVPSFPSVVSVTQAVALADPATKPGRGRGRGRGRGQKAQSGVEAPRRRGKRQNPDEPAGLEVSTAQDTKPVEVAERKSRANIGRRPTRRSKQEQDLLNQSSAISSVNSLSITNPAIAPVSDSRSEDEGASLTKKMLSDVAPNLVTSVLQPVLEDKESQGEQPTDGTRTGAPMIPGNEVLEESETRKQTNSNQSNPSESKVSSESDKIEESKAVRDDKTPSIENQHEEKAQMDLMQSGPSLMLPDMGLTVASEVEQGHMVTNVNSCESDPSQSISEADRQMNISNMDVPPHSVLGPSVVVNKDLLHAFIDANTPQNESGPSIRGVDAVDQETKFPKESDMQSDVNAEISISVPRIVDLDKKASDSHSDASVIVSGLVAVSEHASEEQVATDKINDVVGSEGLKSNPDSLVDVITNATQNIEVLKATGVLLGTTAEKNEDNARSVQASNIVVNSSVCNSEDPLAGAKKETDVQSDMAAVSSGRDAAEIADDMGKDESTSERRSSSVTPVSEMLHVGNEENELNKVLADKELLQGDIAVSAPPTGDKPAEVSNIPFGGISNISNKLDMLEVESKVFAVSDISGSRSQLSGDGSSEVNVHSMSAIVQSAVIGSEQENKAEEPVDKCVVDDALVSNLELTANAKECQDDSVLSVSNMSGISSPMDQSCEDIAGVSSFAPVVSRVEMQSETILGEDGSKKVEKKGQVDGPKTSENEEVPASSSELSNERSDGLQMAEEHGNNQNVPSRDSVSALCDDGHAAAISGSLPSNVEASNEKKDEDDSESKATGLNRTESSQETPLLTVGTMSRVVGQLDLSNTENKENEHADDQEVSEFTMGEAADLEVKNGNLVQKQEISEVTMGEAADLEVKNENFVQKQEVSEVNLGEAADLEVKNEDVVLAHGSSINVVVASDGPAVELHKDFDENMSCDRGELENSHVDIMSNSETCELRPTGSSGKSENESGIGNASFAETSAETLQVSEETTIVKECVARVDETNSQSSEEKILLSDSMIETVHRVVSDAKVIEGRNTQNETGPDNSLDTEDDSNKTLSLQVASLDGTRANVFVGEPGMTCKDSAIVVQGSDEVESDKTAAAELNEAPIGATAGTSQPKLGLEQLVEETGMMCKDSAIEVQGSEEVESDKTAAAELHEAQISVTARTSQPKNGLEQLVEEPGMMMSKDSAIEVQGSEEVESENTAAAERHKAQTGATAGTSQLNNGLEQLEDSAIEVQGSEEVESDKTAAEELHEAQTGATAGTSQPNIGLEQLENSANEVQGSEEVESDKTAAEELQEAQTGATAGTSQPKNGLEQLVEEYSDEE